MKAIRVHSFGGPEVLTFEDIATPEPGPGQALIKIAAAGVNYIDIYHRTGLYPNQLPLTLGVEGAGTVAAIGPDVTDVRVGDRVAYTGVPGAYAEYALVPSQRLVPVPDEITLEQAAAVLLQGMTAQFLTYSTYPIHPGDQTLIHAAAGGVGLLLVQLAKRRGAHIFATVSTPEKGELARAAGADEIILYKDEDFEEVVKHKTDGKGVHVVYDSVGQTTFHKSLSVLRPRGTMVLFGQSSGPVAPFDPSLLNAKGSLFLTRPSLFHYIAERSELLDRAGVVLGALASGELSLRIEHSLPLEQAAQAHSLLASRATSGKLLLIPG
ncbi:MAG: quinone oxidoreductase [Roseiflexaceae bacterium]